MNLSIIPESFTTTELTETERADKRVLVYFKLSTNEYAKLSKIISIKTSLKGQ